MTLLQPLALALAVLALPVIAFYLLKTRRRRRPVPTLIFWEQLDPKIENSPLWRKLRRWISLAVQLLILALIILALARPAFRWETGAASRTVAVLDPGPSLLTQSGRTTREELVRQALLDHINRLRLNDEMAVITTETPPRILSGWTSSRSELRRAVADWSPAPTAIDPRAAIILARSLAGQKEDAAEIVVFSDAVWAGEDWSGLIEGISFQPGPLPVPANAGITHFAGRRLPDAPGGWQLEIEVATSSAEPWSGALHLTRNQIPLDSVPLELGAGETWRRTWSGVDPGEVLFAAELKSTASGDALTTDNTAAVELPPLRPLRVLLTGTDDPFLQAAFASLPLVEWEQRAWQASDAGVIDLVVGRAPSDFPSDAGVAALVIHPSENGFWGERLGQVAGGPITDSPDDEVLLRHVGLRQVSFTSAGRWQLPPGARVLAGSLGEPVIFGRWSGEDRWLVLAFDPAASDLPLRTAFPILLGNLAESLRTHHTADAAAAALPGRTATSLDPIPVNTHVETISRKSGWAFPGWMWAILAGLIVLTVEAFLYHRRILD